MSRAPCCRIVALPFPRGVSTACVNAGKFASAKAADRAPNVATARPTWAEPRAISVDTGRRNRALAWPLRPVVAEAGTICAPGDAVNVTVRPAKGLPL